MMASCHHSKFIFIILFLIQILFNSILCPLPPPTRHLARNVIRIVLNLPEQPFSQHLNHNTSHEFKQTAENINEAFNLFWQTEPSYRGSRVIRLRYNQVLGTIATIDLIFELPLNTSIAVLHRLKWELMRALKDGRIGWINASVDGFEFTPVEGPFSSPTLACPDGSLPEFSIHGSTYCWSHSVCPSGTACEHGQCCKNAELTPRRNCDPIKEWECADGLCIPISFRCDGKEDCVLDVEERAFALGMLLHRPSDELYCPTGNEKRSVQPSHAFAASKASEDCLAGSFVCREDRTCISPDLVCDRKYDCADQTDEKTCDYFINAVMQAKAKQLEEERLKKEKDKEGQCGPEEVPCPETATIRCIHYTSLCDNVDDCGDGYDESNCVSSESRDEEKIITISPENVINAYCAPGEFQCRDGSCIPDSSRCNRNYDCGLTDGSDEEGCAYWKEAEEAERRRKEEEQKQLAEYHEQQRQRAEEEKNRRIEECRRRGGFLCPGQDKCVERSNVCDGRSDCANGDDEKNCPVSEEETEIQITVYPAELTVQEGREASFECRARATDNSIYPEVRWTRVGGRLPDGVYESGGRLVFSNTKLAHSGRYICLAMHKGRSVEAFAQLQVQSFGPQEFQTDNNQVTQPITCSANERACGGNECVKMEYVCDGERDCRDGSDELNCPSKRHCEPNEFRCNNEKCVQKMWLCDGDDDCGDGSDEINCKQRKPGDLCQSTEFSCKDGRQCVPSSFHCDGTNDCHDGSDEIGCVQPTVVAPPQSNVVVPQGGEFKLTCRAVGVPDPYINWRLNWADVCEPPRCQQVSEGGVGTLTVQNAQPLDQGAYTCEAINVKGRVLATPDCIVRIVSIPAPEPIPQLRAPPPEQRTCASPTSYQAPQGCLRCFCFGVTDKCRSSMLFRTKEKLFFAAEAQGVQLADQDGRTTPGTQFDFDRYGFVGHKEPHHGQTLYWKMPQRFLGNKVTAYGGDLSVKLLYEGPGPGRIEPLVIIRGNGITLIHRARDQESVFTPGREFTVTVPTYEQYYEHRDGRGSASREDLMMVLADLDLFMIRATHTDSQTSTSIGDTSLEIAVARDTQEKRALEVEQCECPPGYTGTSCEDCAEGYERIPGGRYLGTCVPRRQPPQPVCSAVGSLSTQPQWDGRCQCKQNVIGSTCDRCAPESYSISKDHPGGCLRCWCSGVTAVCESSHWRRSKVELDYSRGDIDQLEAVSSDQRSPFKSSSQALVTDGAIQLDDFSGVPTGTQLYWSLPQKFLGDKVTSYGGKFRYTFRFTSSSSGISTFGGADADVVLRGNNIQLEYTHQQHVEPDVENSIEVPLTEAGWRRSQDGQPITREQFLMALADLDAVLIKISCTSDCATSSLLNVHMDIADAYGTGELALDVEHCQCPPGYQGTSCEICAPNYFRAQGGPYMGICERCECHSHASQCDKEYGACIGCQHNTEGDRCERCKPGFTGDARRGTPHDCLPVEQPARPSCQCYNHSPRGCDSYGRCIQCEHNTEGFHCEVCKKGYYGQAIRGTPFDCTACPCPGDRECFLDERGQVQCKNCPPGYSGGRCDECAPGYTRSQTGGGRECEPIGRHRPSEVDFVPAPEEGTLIPPIEESIVSIVEPDPLLPAESRGVNELEVQAAETETKENDVFTHPASTIEFLGTGPIELTSERNQTLDFIDMEIQVLPHSSNGVIVYATSSAPSIGTPAILHRLELINGYPQYSFKNIYLNKEKVFRSNSKLVKNKWSILRVINNPRGRASLRVNSEVPSELIYSTPVRTDKPSTKVFGSSRIFLGGVDPYRTQKIQKSSLPFVGSIGRLRLNDKEVDLKNLKEIQGGIPLEENTQQKSSLEQRVNECSREPCKNSGRCFLDRWGVFQCHCQSGFTGRFCTLPSMDGVCPVDRRRWCYRGACLWEGGQATCLCPPGWLGQQCKEKDEKFDDEMKSIEFNGQNSLLAFSLNSTRDDGEESEDDGFLVEFRLNPTEKSFNQEQLLAVLMRERDEQVLAGVTMQPQNELQQSSHASKKSLIKKLKPQKSMLIRIENLGKDEVGILVDGRPKGTWKLPSLKYAEQSSGILLLIGGLLPQQRTEEYKNSVQLYKVTPFSGCLSELSVNGHSLGLKDLINKKGSVAVNLNSCQLKEEETEYKVEEREEYTTTSTTPRYIPVVTEVTEDPLPLLVEKDVGYREEQVKSEEKKYKQEDVEASPSYPGIMLDSVSPDLLPTVLEKTQTPEAIYNTIQMGNEASTVSPLKEKIEDYEDIEEMTTLMPAPSVVLLPSSGEMSNYKMSTDKTSIEKMSSIETSTYTMPHIETSTDKMPTTIIYSTEGQPVVKVEKQKEILEGLEQKIFPGLCDQKTCGIHGSCEEINSTHVTCHCRDFWAGQACEEFQPLEYAAGFDGSAFVVFSSEEFPHMISDLEEVIQFKLRTRARYGLIFWQGQHPSLDGREKTEQFGEDFLSISLLGGHLSFTYELGGGAAQLISERPLNDGKTHLIRTTRRGRNGTLQINRGKVVEGRSSGILAMLNVEGNIFIGGVPDLNIMTAGMFNHNFVGCLGEVELNGQIIDLMANAIDGRNVRPCGGWKSKISSKGRRKRLLRRLRRKHE